MLHVLGLDHIVLNVLDVDRSLRFYADGLGLATERLAAFRRGDVPFPSVRLNDETIIDLFPPRMHDATAGTGANLNHLCLVVAETAEEIRARLEAIDAPIERGPVPGFGARGTGTSYYTRDPDGNGVEVRTYCTNEDSP